LSKEKFVKFFKETSDNATFFNSGYAAVTKFAVDPETQALQQLSTV
jgi:hypothetical protein